MKNCLLLVTVLLLSIKSFEQKNKLEERLGVPGPLVFGDTNFKLAWTNHSDTLYYIQKYLPSGDSLVDFKQMLHLELLRKDTLLEKLVQQETKVLEERKKVDHYCNYNVISSPEGDEFILDFLTSENSNGKILQFNIWHYKLVNIEGKGRRIELFAYTKRSYDSEIKSFLKNFGKDRITMLDKMVAAGMPAITKDL
jgi:hypothetical protein